MTYVPFATEGALVCSYRNGLFRVPDHVLTCGLSCVFIGGVRHLFLEDYFAGDGVIGLLPMGRLGTADSFLAFNLTKVMKLERGGALHKVPVMSIIPLGILMLPMVGLTHSLLHYPTHFP